MGFRSRDRDFINSYGNEPIKQEPSSSFQSSQSRNDFDAFSSSSDWTQPKQQPRSRSRASQSKSQVRDDEVDTETLSFGGGGQPNQPFYGELDESSPIPQSSMSSEKKSDVLITRTEGDGAIIYSREWLLNQLNDFSVLVLTNIVFISNGKSLPTSELAPIIKKITIDKRVAGSVVTGARIVKKKLTKGKNETAEAYAARVSIKPLVEIFEGFQQCLKFILYVGHIFNTKQAFGRPYDSLEDYKNVIEPLYNNMLSSGAFVREFTTLYSRFVINVHKMGVPITQLDPVAYSLIIADQSPVFDFGQSPPEGFQNQNYSVKDYITDIYTYTSFMEKLKIFLEPLVNVSKYSIATMSTTKLTPSHFATLYSTFEHNTNDEFFVERVNNPFNVKSSNTADNLRNVRARLEVIIGKRDAEYQELKQAFDQAKSQIIQLKAAKTVSFSDQRRQQQRRDDRSFGGDQKRNDRVPQNPVFKDSYSDGGPDAVKNTEILAAAFFAYIFEKIKSWFPNPSYKTNIDRIFKTVDDAFTPEALENILKSSKENVGGVIFLTNVSAELGKFMESNPNEIIRTMASNLFKLSSNNWIFGKFSISHRDDRFFSSELISKLSPSTLRTVNTIVFLRRLLVAKTFTDYVGDRVSNAIMVKNNRGGVVFNDGSSSVLDLVYKNLSGQTNQGIQQSIIDGVSGHFKSNLQQQGAFAFLLENSIETGPFLSIDTSSSSSNSRSKTFYQPSSSFR